jgi:3-hydroxymyristoyl/3-hydroxydecanoyl-(acyl carrier protein) dehydratase
MLTLLNRTDLEVILPHRGLNLFIDEVTVAPDKLSSSSRLRLRDVPCCTKLLTRSGPTGRIWSEPFMAELLALTGAPLVSQDLPPGHVAAFGMLSRVKFGTMPSLDDEVQAEVTVLRKRDQTTFFKARLENHGAIILEAEVASSVVDLAVFACRPAAAPLPDGGTPICMSSFGWKDSRLRLLDCILSEDAAAHRLSAGFTFSACHPFVQGHFPTAPLMMGVLQWAAMVDAVWLAYTRFGHGSRTILANGSVKRADGTLVAEIKDLLIDIIDGAPYIRETKRVIFREPVYLTNRVIIDVTLSVDAAQPVALATSA